MIRHFHGTDTVTLELNIEFSYDGYDDPGRTYGPPERCYPPEREMNVEIIGARVGDELIHLDGRACNMIADCIVTMIETGKIETESDADRRDDAGDDKY